MSGAFPQKRCWIVHTDTQRLQGIFLSTVLTSGVIDIAGMMARKEKIVSQLTGGVSGLLKANGVSVITGAAILGAGRKVEVTSSDSESQSYTADHVVLAAGSEPAAIPPAPGWRPRCGFNRGAML